MISENDLRDRLDAVDVPPTGLRVETLVAQGRKRVLQRRTVRAACGVALATGLLVGVPSVLLNPGGGGTTNPIGDEPASSASAEGPREPTAVPGLPTVRCAGKMLAVPAGMTTVQPVAVDTSGRYIVGNDVRMSELDTPEGKVAGVGDSQAILWTDGTPQALPKLGDWVSASAVNADGVVAAIAGPKDKWADAVIRYTGGVPHKLTPLTGKWTFESAEINTAGDIVANATRQSTAGNRIDAVMLWKAGAQTATKLPLPLGAEARSILDDDRIVGVLAKGSQISDLNSYVWTPQGKGTKLENPQGQNGSVYEARGDWATGNLWPAGAVARWNLKTGEVTEVAVDAPGNSINASGWIASAGTILRDDANVELQLADDDVKGEPIAVSDTGVVVGLPFDGSSGAISWRCER